MQLKMKKFITESGIQF